MEKNAIYHQAIEYLDQGFSIIPLIPRGKKPLINWTEFQTRYATKEEVDQWFAKWPDANLGIVTGQISGVVVVDFDTPEAFKEAEIKGLPESPTVKTSRGYHRYFKWRFKVSNFQKRDDLPGIDLRGDGGYVVAPWSIHESGHKYHWTEDLGIGFTDLVEIPDWIFAKDETNKKPLKELYRGVSEGSRNEALASMVGSWVDDGLSVNGCMESARIFNQNNKPPLEDKELQAVVESIYKIHTEKKKNSVEAVEDVEVVLGDIFPLVDFPLDVIPDNLRRFILNVSTAYNVSIDSVAVAVLAILSMAIGNSIRVSPKADWQEPVFLWVMIIGRSGSGKTPFIKKLLKPVDDLQRNEFKIFNKEYKDYEIKVANYKKLSQKKAVISPLDEKPERPLLRHYKVSDATVEALADIMSSSPRGVLMHQDELSGFILGLNQYKGKGNDLQKYLELWNCSPWKVDRVLTGTKYIHDTGCAILGGIQPLVLPAIFKEESIIDGLLPRFLFTAIIQDSIYTGDSLSWKDEQFWDEIVNQCYAVELKKDEFGNNSPTVLKFDQCSSDIYKQFKLKYKEQGKYLPERAKVFLPKLESYVVRTSGILHVLRQKSDHISFQTLNDSIKIVDYFTGQAMSMLTQYGKSNQLSEIETSLIKVLADLKTKVVHGKLKLSDITTSLNSLLPQFVQQTPENIKSILSKKLKLETKLVGGYSHLIWDETKIDKLCKLYIGKASTTSTTSTIKEEEE